MMTIYYVMIHNGMVANRTVADAPLPEEWFPEGETWVQNDEAQIGWAFDGKAFTPPAREPEPEPGPIIIPYAAFRARWTDDEMAGLFSTRKTVWQVDDYITLASAQGSVNLSGPTAAAAKALFVKLGVLTAERTDAIFATS